MTAPGRRVCQVLALCLACLAFACGSPAAPSNPTTPPVTSAFSEASFRRAALITAETQFTVRNSTHAGMSEGEVVAAVNGMFALRGSGAPAFNHIVASGPNALDLHYEPVGGGRQIGDGDLVLVDIGATYDQHCADVTRTFPASGQFSARQREIYQLVFDAQKMAVSQARVGIDSIATIHTRVRDFFRASTLRAKDGNGVDQTMDRFFTHAVGHYVGRQVHGEDTGWKTTEPLATHQVLAIEPGLYIASENLGVRIEDTFLVNDSGLECLSCMSPKELSAAGVANEAPAFARLLAMPREVGDAIARTTSPRFPI